MKTFSRLIRRSVFAAVAAVLLIVAVNVAALFYVGWRGAVLNGGQQAGGYSVQKVAAALTANPDGGGLTLDGAHTVEEWLAGYAWAMVLDDDGRVVWQYALPSELDHRYTAQEVASFARWYLDDYPVLSYGTDHGLLVLGCARGSVVRWNLWSRRATIDLELAVLPWVLAADLALVLLVCLLASWRANRSLSVLAGGIQALAEGKAPALPETGFTGELAADLNRTGRRLQAQNRALARRDAARTNWIAGVSHDIRTPLALILGWAEQLQGDAALPAAAREKAGGVRAQALRIRSLVEDLNLASKLQYDAQPLRRERLRAAPLLRRCVAEFCDGEGAACPVDFALDAAAEAAVLDADAALLARAAANLLGNTARHAPGSTVTVRGTAANGALRLTFADDGPGYPPAVLAALRAGTGTAAEPQGDAPPPPHILGLHLVEQIAAAHGGTAVFSQNTPHGAKAELTLPLAPKAEK